MYQVAQLNRMLIQQIGEKLEPLISFIYELPLE